MANKSHKLPFHISIISSSSPLEVIYSDVWGPSPFVSIDNFKYYVIFIDHFSKYVWLYPLKFKYDVSTIFPIFKNLVENQFNHKIKSFYSNNGGEFIKLKSYFQNNGIQHLTTPPHTPQHNGLCERKHRHLLETTRCLLHQASLPPMFWSFAAQTAYLINRLLTPTLKMHSPFFTLFQTKPNYNKLRSFWCLCFPWLKPYTSHKLEPRYEPCAFLGYSLSQSAYICYNSKTNKFYNFRHVQFIENIFPYSKTSSQEHTYFPHLNSNDINPNYSSPLTITHPIEPIPTLTPNLTHQTIYPPQETIHNNPTPLPRT